MAPVRRRQAEAAVAAFPQVMSLTRIGSHLAGGSSFVRLAGARVAPLVLVVGRVQAEGGGGFARCGVLKVRL